MKLAILYTRPGSYTRACLAALKATHTCEILAIQYKPRSEMAYAAEPLQGLATIEYRDAFRGAAEIARRVAEFRPDGVLVSGWKDKGYLAAAKALRRAGMPVIALMDTQYKGTWRQKAASWAAPYYLHPSFDVIWAAGERQAQLARRFGYAGRKCWTGMLCCEWEKYAEARAVSESRDRAFLFVGRYVNNKGMDVLLEAYKTYRQQVADPWQLRCAGKGPLAQGLVGQQGVQDLGFVQPDDMPALMARCGAFVLASRREPWGVVVQEAAAAGLPLICSDRVGAAVHLLQDHYNGYSFASGNVGELARCMQRMSGLSDGQRAEMGRRSHELSKQYMPERWVETLVHGLEMLRRP